MEYDYLNRLTQAKHVAAHDGGAKILGQYSEKLTYADARGNIAAIQRYGVIPGASYPSGMIDNLSFTMKPGSNQLQRVADSAPTEFAPRGFKPATGAQNIDYTYDPVGNQTSDPHKGITITYNYLNLPSVILWSNGNKMEMSYDAMGTKLSKKVSVGATEQYTQHYLGGIEYNAVGATRKLEAIYFADGRVYNTNVTTGSTTVALRYEYAIRDHLGNTRLMFADLDNLGTISSNEILQENHFYPFGMNMEGVWINDAGAKDSKYLYNGKELNDDFGLGWMDYGARWYDAGIGRWNAVDPSSENYLNFAPYHHSGNDPMNIIDVDGADWIITRKANKNGGYDYSITINAVVYNSTGEKLDMDLLAKNIKSQVEANFSTENTDDYRTFDTHNTTVKMKMNIKAIDKLDEAKETDHLIIVMGNKAYSAHAIKNGEDNDGKSNGIADIKGLKIIIPKRVAFDKNNKRTISHELMHTAGFRHPEGEPGAIVQGANKMDKRFDSNLVKGESEPYRNRLFDTQYDYMYQNPNKMNKQTQFRTEGGKRRINWSKY